MFFGATNRASAGPRNLFLNVNQRPSPAPAESARRVTCGSVYWKTLVHPALLWQICVRHTPYACTALYCGLIGRGEYLTFIIMGRTKLRTFFAGVLRALP